MTRAAAGVNFWASATLDIEDAGWKTFAGESGIDVAFTDNGNDPGPVVAKLAAGSANDTYDVGGLQGGSEKELAKQGLIAAGISPNRIVTVGNGVTDPKSMPSVSVRRVDINVGP